MNRWLASRSTCQARTFLWLERHVLRRGKSERRQKGTLRKAMGGLEQANELLGNIDRGRSKVCRNLRKKNLRLLTGFLTRNCTFQVHRHNIGIVDDAFSRFCGDEKETPRHHLLINCGVITVKRSSATGGIKH